MDYWPFDRWHNWLHRGRPVGVIRRVVLEVDFRDACAGDVRILFSLFTHSEAYGLTGRADYPRATFGIPLKYLRPATTADHAAYELRLLDGET